MAPCSFILLSIVVARRRRPFLLEFLFLFEHKQIASDFI